MAWVGVIGARAGFCGLFALLVAGVAEDVIGGGLIVDDAAFAWWGDFVLAATGAQAKFAAGATG